MIATLLMLLCRARCSASKVASELTFFPPHPPFYALREKEEEGGAGELELTLADALEAEDYPPARVALVPRKKRKGAIVVALYIPPPQSSAASPAHGATFTLIYSHGNAADIGSMHSRCVGLAKQLRVNVVIYDYTGYGRSEGQRASVIDTYADIECVWEWTRAQCPQSRILLYGQSVGSGPSCYLATRQPQQSECAGLILHSPITSGLRVLTSSRALGCLDIYPNLERMPDVACPVLILHGEEDDEVPIQHGKALLEAALVRKQHWWVPNRGHNDMCDRHEDLVEYYRRLKHFLNSLE